MKRVIMPILFAFFLIFPLINAACSLDVSMINQEPYPAIPGETVKVVFQINGIENRECGIVDFELKENFPFSIDPSSTKKISINAGTYSRSYSSFYLATYKLRIDENALKGNNPLEIGYSMDDGAQIIKEFDIYVQDTKANFEVHVKNYDYETRILTLEVLNIEDVDIEALTMEIPRQEGISVKGANRKVIGSLDANEYTTAEFEVILPKEESKIDLNIFYTDSINSRRSLTKKVNFDPSYFLGRNGDKRSFSWIWIILVVGIFAWFFYKGHKKRILKKDLEKRRH
jgi:hypothetical protein